MQYTSNEFDPANCKWYIEPAGDNTYKVMELVYERFQRLFRLTITLRLKYPMRIASGL
jgi:hypothetical protein